MSKYDPLTRYLQGSKQEQLRVGFAQLQELLGFALPKSAKLYAAWWSNSEGSHVQASAWLSAGYETANLDLQNGQVDFVRVFRTAAGGTGGGFGEMQQEVIAAKAPPAIDVLDLDGNKVTARHPAFASLMGTTFVLPDVDLTAPADPAWRQVYDDGHRDAVIEGPAPGVRKAS